MLTTLSDGRDEIQDPRLIRAYSALRSLQSQSLGDGMERTWKVPMLVVLGGQSTGKTSFIESIVGWGVGYTCRETATKCPVRYVLRSGSTSSYSVGGRRVEGRLALREAVQAHMKALGKKIVEDVLVVEIQEDGMFDIDITDLPGLKDRMEPDAAAIAAITKLFLDDRRTIPVVMCEAAKSHDTQHGLDCLQELGLKFKESLVVMNYFNKQIVDMTHVSQVNSYVRGQKRKFPKVHFVMLHYKDRINKEEMTFDQLAEYNKNLPENEREALDDHLQRMEKDESLFKDVLESFGVRQAHKHMQGVLLEWIHQNFADLVSWLRDEIARREGRLEQMAEQLTASDPERVAEAWRQYANAFEDLVSKMFDGENTQFPQAGPRDGFGPIHQWADMSKVRSTYAEERARIVTPPSEDLWLEESVLESRLEDSFTGRQLGQSLGPHAAFDRLVRVLCYNLFTMPLEWFDEEDVFTKCGHSRDGVTHTSNKHTVIRQLVTQGLLRMEGTVGAAVAQIEAIYMLPLKHVHNSLAPFHPRAASHAEFHRMLDATYERRLRAYLTQATISIRESIIKKTYFLPADLPNRILMLSALTPMVPDVLRMDPSSAYHEEAAHDAYQGPRKQSPVAESPSVVRQREALLAMKSRLFEQQTRGPFHPIHFVEGGLQDLHQEEYRSPNVEEINRVGEQYFSIVKGQVCLEVETILDHDVYQPLLAKEKLLRETREEMLQKVEVLFEEKKIAEVVGGSQAHLEEELRAGRVELQQLKEALKELAPASMAPVEDAQEALPRPRRAEFVLLLQVDVQNCGSLVKRNVSKAARQDLVRLMQLQPHDVNVQYLQSEMLAAGHTLLNVDVPAAATGGVEELISQGRIQLSCVPNAYASCTRRLHPPAELGFVAETKVQAIAAAENGLYGPGTDPPVVPPDNTQQEEEEAYGLGVGCLLPRFDTPGRSTTTGPPEPRGFSDEEDGDEAEEF